MTMQTLMGGFCLVSVWLVALLSAADVLIDWRSLRALRARHAHARRGMVKRGAGPDGALASHTVEQRVRALEGALPAVGFWDQRKTCLSHGGEVELEGQALSIQATDAVDVWPDAQRQREAASESPTELTRLWAEAQRGTKAHRVVVTALRPGQPVWVDHRGEARLLLSAVDPRAWASKRMALCLAFAALGVVWASMGTAITLLAAEPWGWVGKIGALVLLTLFLGLTPLCVKVRTACKPPHLAPLDGEQTLPQLP